LWIWEISEFSEFGDFGGSGDLNEYISEMAQRPAPQRIVAKSAYAVVLATPAQNAAMFG
jgi:hypothetical protein